MYAFLMFYEARNINYLYLITNIIQFLCKNPHTGIFKNRIVQFEEKLLQIKRLIKIIDKFSIK